MDDQRGAVLDRAAQVRGRHRVVHDQRDIRLPRHFRYRGDIGNHATGVGEAFDEDRLGLGRQRLAVAVGILAIDEDRLPAESAGKLLANWLSDPP